MIAVLRDLLHFSWILFDNLSCGFMRSCCDADFAAAAVISSPLRLCLALPSDMPAHNFVGGKLARLMVLNVAEEWRGSGLGKWLQSGRAVRALPLSLSCVYVGVLSTFLTCVLAFRKIATKWRAKTSVKMKFLLCTFCTWKTRGSLRASNALYICLEYLSA